MKHLPATHATDPHLLRTRTSSNVFGPHLFDTWVSMFRAVVETPVQAQEEHQMDLATFAQWSTAFSVLVPVSRDVVASAGDRAQLRAHAKTLPLLLCAMSVCREDCA